MRWPGYRTNMNARYKKYAQNFNGKYLKIRDTWETLVTGWKTNAFDLKLRRVVGCYLKGKRF